MTPILLIRRDRGLSFVELMVALGISSLMFIAVGYLIVMTGRNTILVSEQALSQNHASAAGERLTNIIRNSSSVEVFSGDNASTAVKRLKFTDATTGQVGCVAFQEPSTATDSDGVVKIFLDASKYDATNLATTKADYEYTGIEKFSVIYRTSTWVTMSIFYSYRSYMNFASHDDNYDNKLAGEFITDAIAKNHHPGESANYAQTTTSVFLL